MCVSPNKFQIQIFTYVSIIATLQQIPLMCRVTQFIRKHRSHFLLVTRNATKYHENMVTFVKQFESPKHTLPGCVANVGAVLASVSRRCLMVPLRKPTNEALPCAPQPPRPPLRMAGVVTAHLPPTDSERNHRKTDRHKRRERERETGRTPTTPLTELNLVGPLHSAH